MILTFGEYRCVPPLPSPKPAVSFQPVSIQRKVVTPAPPRLVSAVGVFHPVEWRVENVFILNEIVDSNIHDAGQDYDPNVTATFVYRFWKTPQSP